MKYRSVFDIIGPVMIGPSALIQRELPESGEWPEVYLAESLSASSYLFTGLLRKRIRATAQMSRLSADCLILIHSTNGLKPLYKLQKIKEFI